MEIEITFINQSNDENNSSVVIFHKNSQESTPQTAVAWILIKNCGRGWSHKFKYPKDISIGVSDSWGNVSDMKPEATGKKWKVVRSKSGDELVLDPQPGIENQVEISNCLPEGAIDALIYKDGKLFATREGISPGFNVSFLFEPYLGVGVVSQIEEGEVMNSAVLSDISTTISLLGITKANLIMTGGGVGPESTPFVFELVPTA